MTIIGCDSHPRFQQIAFVNQEMASMVSAVWGHPGEAEQFYRSLAERQVRNDTMPAGPNTWLVEPERFPPRVNECKVRAWVVDARKGGFQIWNESQEEHLRFV
jgi:hypothetical protein